MTKSTSKERVRRYATRQHGRVTWAQLKRLEVSDATIHTWLTDGYLVSLLPKVYAVGHTAPSREADLWTAILYAGPNAMLSHATAAQWRGLIDYPPAMIEVTTPRKIKSIAGVRVYAERRLTRHFHKHFPVTSIPDTVVDLAASADARLVRRALATLDYSHNLDIDALNAICNHGRPGSRLLRRALDIHEPQLAHTNGRLEDDFLHFCELHDIPVPEFNAIVHGIQVDAYWREHDLVVELDGLDNHSSKAQLRRDKRNDLRLRGHGLTVYRYDWVLLHDQGQQVRDEILDELSRARARARPRPTPSARPPRRRRPAPGSPRRPSG